MTAASAVLLCALDLMGRSPASMPSIQFVASPPPGVSVNAEAFVHEGGGVIYLITSSPGFRDARCGDRPSLVRLAAILAHEEWHVRHGPDERSAYQAQLMMLMRLGAGPDTMLFHNVYRSMRFVLKSREREARAAAAAAAAESARDDRGRLIAKRDD
jgi:hypothetical protein